MAVQWTDAEIESGITLIFTRLGYHEVKTEQLEAIRGLSKIRTCSSPFRLEAASLHVVAAYLWCLKE